MTQERQPYQADLPEWGKRRMFTNDVQMLTLNQYQVEARRTAIYPNINNNVQYPALGLAGETGEVCNQMKKVMRDDDGVITIERRIDLEKELGDVLWYLVALSSEIDEIFQNIGYVTHDPDEDEPERDFAWMQQQMLDCRHEILNEDVWWCINSMMLHAGAICGLVNDLKEAQDELRADAFNYINEEMWAFFMCLIGFCIKADIVLQFVAEKNIAKLKDRQQRGALQGSGDNR